MKRLDIVLVYKEKETGQICCGACYKRDFMNPNIYGNCPIKPYGTGFKCIPTVFDNTKHDIIATLYECNAKKICERDCNYCKVSKLIIEYGKWVPL